jgi:hypothetical protein
VLKKGEPEVPSDFAGVGYIYMDDRAAWKAELPKSWRTRGTLSTGRKPSRERRL